MKGMFDSSNPLVTPSVKQIKALHEAASNGDIHAFDQLVLENINPHIKDTIRRTALHFAAQFGQLLFIKHFITQYGNQSINEEMNAGSTPLLFAAQNGHNAIIDFLVSKGAKIDAINRSCSNALHCAVMGGKNATIDHLVNRYQFDPKIQNRQADTLLHYASRYGQAHTIHHLISVYGLQVNAQNNKLDTPLHCVNTNVEAIDVLLKLGADRTARNKLDNTPLFSSTNLNHDMIVNHFLSLGFDVSEENSTGETLLHKAVLNGHATLVEQLISEFHMDVNKTTLHGVAVLHIAIEKKYHHIVKYLLAAGADPNKKHDEETALHKAVKNKDLTCVQELVACDKTSIIARDKQNETVIHKAIINNEIAILECLVNIPKNNGDKMKLTNDGDNPFHLAAKHKNVAAINCLAKAKLPINDKNRRGMTALHIAIEEKCLDTVKCLIKNGADITIKNDANLTPLDFAVHLKCDLELIDLLLASDKVDLSQKDEQGSTIFHRSVTGREIKIDFLSCLLKKCKNVTEANQKDAQGYTPIHLAAASGSIEAVNIFIKAGVNPEETTSNNDTVLHVAIQKRQFHLVDYLVNNYALQLDKKNNDGSTVFHLAARFAERSILDLLLSKNPQLLLDKDNNGWTSMHYAAACITGIDGIAYLESNGLKIGEKTHLGSTVFHIAAEHNCVDTLKYLSKKLGQLHLNSSDNNRWSLLHYAAKNGSCDAFLYVLANASKLSVTTQSSTGCTPLHIAAQYSQPIIFSRLEAFQSEFFVKNNLGYTPFHVAIIHSNKHLLEKIRQAYIPILKDKVNGLTVLEFATIHGRSESFISLCRLSGLSAKERNDQGETVAHVAVKHNTFVGMASAFHDLSVDLEVKDIQGNTVLDLVVRKGDLKAIDTALKYMLAGAKKAALTAAAEAGNSKVIDHLLAKYNNLSITMLESVTIEDQEVNELKKNGLSFLEALNTKDFTKIQACLQEIPQYHKKMILNWKYFKESLIDFCLKKCNVDILTLLLCEGLSQEKYDKSTYSRQQNLSFNHALLRMQQQNKTLSLAKLLNPSMIIRFIDGCKHEGPWQHIDQYILIENLITFNLIVTEKYNLDSIKINQRDFKELTEIEKINTYALAFKMLNTKISDFLRLGFNIACTLMGLGIEDYSEDHIFCSEPIHILLTVMSKLRIENDIHTHSSATNLLNLNSSPDGKDKENDQVDNNNEGEPDNGTLISTQDQTPSPETQALLCRTVNGGNIEAVHELFTTYSFSLADIEFLKPQDSSIKNLLDNVKLFHAKILTSNFEEIKELLQLFPVEEKKRFLNWLYHGKSLLQSCMTANNTNLLTLFLFHGMEPLQTEQTVEHEEYLTYLHALLRFTYVNPQEDNYLHYLSNEHLLKKVIAACKTKDPYQELDRQILFDALSTFNLITTRRFSLDSIVFADHCPLTKEIESNTSLLAFYFLNLNLNYSSDNLRLHSRWFASLVGKGMGEEIEVEMTEKPDPIEVLIDSMVKLRVTSFTNYRQQREVQNSDTTYCHKDECEKAKPS